MNPGRCAEIRMKRSTTELSELTGNLWLRNI
jgi:hypothetical protein